MKENLLIIGAGGHGKVVADIALKMNKWKNIFFLDDEKKESLMRIKVIGKSEEVINYIENHDVIVAIGNNEIREEIQTKLEKLNATIPVLVHPGAYIGEEVVIGSGTVIMAGAVINPSTKIGKGCIINTGATVDHDNVIDDFVHISPGSHLAGYVRVAKGTWIGIGSCISNNICISKRCVIGAGSVVIKDIHESGTYVGVPVKKIK